MCVCVYTFVSNQLGHNPTGSRIVVSFLPLQTRTRSNVNCNYLRNDTSVALFHRYLTQTKMPRFQKKLLANQLSPGIRICSAGIIRFPLLIFHMLQFRLQYFLLRPGKLERVQTNIMFRMFREMTSGRSRGNCHCCVCFSERELDNQKHRCKKFEATKIGVKRLLGVVFINNYVCIILYYICLANIACIISTAPCQTREQGK